MSKALYTRIKTVTTSLAKGYTKVHDVAVECLLHAQQHGDARPMQALINALPRATYKEGLAFWCLTYSPIRLKWDTEGAAYAVKVLPDADLYKVEDATAKPFWEMDEVQDALKKQPLSVDKLAKSVTGFKAAKLKQIQKQFEDGLIDEPTANGMRAYLERVEVTVRNAA